MWLYMAAERNHLLGSFDTGQIGAMRGREVVPRARLSGKKEPTVYRCGEGGTRIRMARKRVRIGSPREKIAAPAGVNERAQAEANAAAEKTSELVGVHIVGPEASDLISEGALALEMHAFLEDIGLTIHPHPTLGEGMMEASLHGLGQAVHVMNR